MLKIKEIVNFKIRGIDLLKKLSIYSIFALFLANFLFPQLVEAFSSSDDESINYISYELEAEKTESENESEELEEVEMDDYLNDQISAFCVSKLKVTDDNLISDFYYSFYKDNLTPPPEIV